MTRSIDCTFPVSTTPVMKLNKKKISIKTIYNVWDLKLNLKTEKSSFASLI